MRSLFVNADAFKTIIKDGSPSQQPAVWLQTGTRQSFLQILYIHIQICVYTDYRVKLSCVQEAFKQMHITPFSGLIAALNYTHRDLKLEPRAEAQQCFQTLYDLIKVIIQILFRVFKDV